MGGLELTKNLPVWLAGLAVCLAGGCATGSKARIDKRSAQRTVSLVPSTAPAAHRVSVAQDGAHLNVRVEHQRTCTPRWVDGYGRFGPRAGADRPCRLEPVAGVQVRVAMGGIPDVVGITQADGTWVGSVADWLSPRRLLKETKTPVTVSVEGARPVVLSRRELADAIDDDAWAVAENEGSKFWIESYLHHLPKGKHAEEARLALARVAEAAKFERMPTKTVSAGEQVLKLGERAAWGAGFFWLVAGEEQIDERETKFVDCTVQTDGEVLLTHRIELIYEEHINSGASPQCEAAFRMTRYETVLISMKSSWESNDSGGAKTAHAELWLVDGSAIKVARSALAESAFDMGGATHRRPAPSWTLARGPREFFVAEGATCVASEDARACYEISRRIGSADPKKKMRETKRCSRHCAQLASREDERQHDEAIAKARELKARGQLDAALAELKKYDRKDACHPRPTHWCPARRLAEKWRTERAAAQVRVEQERARAAEAARIARANAPKPCGVFEASVVQRMESDLYEVVVHTLLLGVHTQSGQSDHAILRTTRTEFTSKGRFHMEVRNLTTMKVQQSDGFTATWDVYEECR